MELLTVICIKYINQLPADFTWSQVIEQFPMSLSGMYATAILPFTSLLQCDQGSGAAWVVNHRLPSLTSVRHMHGGVSTD